MPRNDPPATTCQPSGLGGGAEATQGVQRAPTFLSAIRGVLAVSMQLHGLFPLSMNLVGAVGTRSTASLIVQSDGDAVERVLTRFKGAMRDFARGLLTLTLSPGERIPPNQISRIEPLNQVCQWQKIAILRNPRWYNGLRRPTWRRFMERGRRTHLCIVTPQRTTCVLTRAPLWVNMNYGWQTGAAFHPHTRRSLHVIAQEARSCPRIRSVHRAA